MLKGRVKAYYEDRGFGFIKPDGAGSRDHFFHIRGFPEDAEPEIGQRVEYVVGKNRNDGRLRAEGIRVLK